MVSIVNILVLVNVLVNIVNIWVIVTVLVNIVKVLVSRGNVLRCGMSWDDALQGIFQQVSICIRVLM